MKAQIAEALNIEPEQIISLNIGSSERTEPGYPRTTIVKYKQNCTETVSGGIILTTENIVTKELVTEGEIDDLAINIGRACNHSLEFTGDSDFRDLDVDNVYASFIKHLLTIATINKEKVIFGDDYYTIDADLSQEKVDAFNTYNNGTRSSAPTRKLRR